MIKFANLFEDTKYGQILVKRDHDEEEKPEVRVFFQPEDMGVCSFSLSFKDTEEGEEMADTTFDKIGQEEAVALVEHALSEAGFSFTTEVE